jgi:pimeloyl-ACP methyl ester carboxylesterase
VKLYAISGLGADRRVFEYLNLEAEIITIDWITPLINEDLKSYARRLSAKINQNEQFALVGVSFGGLVAIEISKILNPSITIIISSAATKYELRKIIRVSGKLGITEMIPPTLFKPPKFIANFLFGTDKKELLKEILDDTDPKFAKWAVNELAKWSNTERIKNLIHICGSNDKLIPPTIRSCSHLIEGGEHFMIVDKAEEISQIINKEIRL